MGLENFKLLYESKKILKTIYQQKKTLQSF